MLRMNKLSERWTPPAELSEPKILSLLIGLALGLPTMASAGTLNIPSGLSQPSPLFGATPFSARLVLFEEFGTQNYDGLEGSSTNTLAAPTKKDPLDESKDMAVCNGNPEPRKLDDIIEATNLYPLPGKFAHDEKDATTGKYVYSNPWEQQIKDCGQVSDVNASLPMDGRPWGEDFAHQRWSQFQPAKFFQSIMAGARESRGKRDDYQMHHYGDSTKHPELAGKFTEFGPGGLYHNTVFSSYEAGYSSDFDGTSKGIPVQIHPNMPIQNPNSVWTFDGTIPAKLLMARYGETLLFRHHNALPIDKAANNGFGTHTITTHEHNGHNPAESDGFAGAYFYPGQFYDYRWPMVLAGHDSINTSAADKRAALPCTPGEVVKTEKHPEGAACPAVGSIQVPGDYRETMSTHWFHDHMLDFTAQNVYKGNAAMMNYYSAIDRGNEKFDDGVNLKFPSGDALSWGNRDYDMNLVVADKAFDQTGQLYFNPLITDGFLGDVMTVNWVYKPFVDVRARRYRFRILNGSVSRYLKIAVAYADPKTGAPVQLPFHMIANDGNILQHSVAFPNSAAGEGLPPQSIAERDDIIIDFSTVPAGVTKVYLVNLMEHATGAGPKGTLTLATAFDAFNPTNKNAYKGIDFAVGKFMEFRIRPLAVGQVDASMNPVEFTETVVDPVTKKNVTGKLMLPLPTFTTAELTNAKHRTFKYGKKADTTDLLPWTIQTDTGVAQNAHIDHISAAPTKETVEIWHLSNPSGGWSHPAHIHFEEGQIIKRNGATPPAWERLGRKDMYRIGPEANSGATVDFAIRVRDFTGTYVEHCHNTQHEDHAMLLRWDSENADHAKWVQTPYPDWTGVSYNVDPEGLGGATNKEATADTGSKLTNEAKSFSLPSGWGLRAADVPTSSAPTP